MGTNGRRSRLGELASWALVFCAFLTTALVVHQEFFPDVSTASTAITTKRQAIYVEEWHSALGTGIISGSQDAPIQVIEFADFECPGCARYEATVRAIREKYSEKQVAVTFAYYPLIYHEFAESAARVAECAHMQGRFEEMRTILFRNQQAFGSVSWKDLATQAGVPNLKDFDACIDDKESSNRVKEAKRSGDKMGVRGTPAVVINGWMLPIPPSLDEFDKIVNNISSGRPPAAGIY